MQIPGIPSDSLSKFGTFLGLLMFFGGLYLTDQALDKHLEIGRLLEAERTRYKVDSVRKVPLFAALDRAVEQTNFLFQVYSTATADLLRNMKNYSDTADLSRFAIITKRIINAKDPVGTADIVIRELSHLSDSLSVLTDTLSITFIRSNEQLNNVSEAFDTNRDKMKNYNDLKNAGIVVLALGLFGWLAVEQKAGRLIDLQIKVQEQTLRNMRG